MNWHRIILVFLMTLLMQYSNHMVSCVITDVQLIGGPASNKGTVEVKQDGGDWETTCGMNLDINDVIVICRQLGFTGASLAVKTTPYGQNSNPVIGLDCNGREHHLGCFEGGTGNDRVFTGDYMTQVPNMTISSCINFCNQSSDANYTYAGVENGKECYCGEASDNYTRHGKRSDDQCHVACSGDPTDSCGGAGHIAVFSSEYHS
ncbi:uncharacterized protein LOC129280025 [Lytechinus pictus]|uniref:uncharacterized protein LOC129280025 n=1 Tax=Lytechinus pictus TaxID=7653 RepID=UPI0030BA17CB